MISEIVVPITRLRPRGQALPLPRYMTPGSAGMDVAADLEHAVVLAPLGRALIPTGFALTLPAGYEAQLRPRSGLALRSGLSLLNPPGTIDSDYRDEVHVLVVNLGDEAVTISHGERIAQLVVAPVVRARWAETDRLNPTERRGGFGHTGVGSDQELEPVRRG